MSPRLVAAMYAAAPKLPGCKRTNHKRDRLATRAAIRSGRYWEVAA